MSANASLNSVDLLICVKADLLEGVHTVKAQEKGER